MSTIYASYPFESNSGGSGVTSLNGETGAVNIVAGAGITVTPSGQNITIAATGGSLTLTGAVTGTGTNTIATKLSIAPSKYYIDFTYGSDSTGNGSLVEPWQSLTHANSQVTATSLAPAVFYLSGGTAPDSSPISLQASISLIADLFVSVEVPITVGANVGGMQDTMFITNVQLEDGLIWTRNDSTGMTIISTNSSFYSGSQPGLDFEQADNRGNAVLIDNGSSFTNTIYTSSSGNCSLTNSVLRNQGIGTNTQFTGGLHTIPQVIFLGGKVTSNIVVTGAFAIVLRDVDTSAGFFTFNGSLLSSQSLDTDSSSISPSNYSGTVNLTYASNAYITEYSPLNPSNWPSLPTPPDVGDALDDLQEGLVLLGQVQNAGHYTSTGVINGYPNIAAGANAGTGATVNFSQTSNDSAGQIQVTLGTAPVLKGDIIDVTFAIPYNSAPIIIFYPVGNFTGAAPVGANVGASSTTGFSLNFGAVGIAGQTYTYNYIVMEAD